MMLNFIRTIFLISLSLSLNAQSFEVLNNFGLNNLDFWDKENIGVQTYKDGWVVSDLENIYFLDSTGGLNKSVAIGDTINFLISEQPLYNQILINEDDLLTIISQTSNYIVFSKLNISGFHSINSYPKSYYKTTESCLGITVEGGNGNFYTTSNRNDTIYLHYINEIGEIIWSNYAKSSPSNFTVDDNDNLFIFRLNMLASGAPLTLFIDKISSNSDTLWTYSNDFVDEENISHSEKIGAIDIDNDGNVIITATVFNENNNSSDLFWAKINSETGEVIYEKTYNNEVTNTNDNRWFQNAFKLDSENNFYGFQAQNDNAPSQMLKVNSEGEVVWLNDFYIGAFKGNAVFETNNCGSDNSNINRNRNNQIFTIDNYNNTFVVRKITDEPLLQLQKYNANGELLYGELVEGSTVNTIFDTDNDIISIEINDKNEICLITVNYSFVPVFIIKDLQSVSNTNVIENKAINVYPNPASKHLFIESNNINFPCELNIYNATGQLVFQKSINTNNNIELNIKNWQNGIYYTQLIGNNGEIIETVRWVKVGI